MSAQMICMNVKAGVTMKSDDQGLGTRTVQLELETDDRTQPIGEFLDSLHNQSSKVVIMTLERYWQLMEEARRVEVGQ